ncbi:putative pentatricopeptide repeat-containing protein At3g18840 [Amborella trichopoda]|uniref:Pentacotripeptide-repeat region of PRORP domain-containing protein n=1 Tax=Amborella trichopoda TaxID=13333 RepID=U5D078_AMBTC|nr:putative pentatricopeptide repeat-containing protein At3g18840 [Amborella trichopoda]ERN15630.1 hypothetical protein AMTR_s00048p00191570 [Amborella trichopoda]|eukprot:XP_006854163.1 putative pentatricopeptide repeat-containing protein At3g18840 [Amborella trichopoda]
MKRHLLECLKLHTHIIKTSLPTTIFTYNQLIEVYFKNTYIGEARQLFNEMPQKNVFSWNTMINGYIKNTNLLDAQFLFDLAPERDTVTYNSLLSGYSHNGFSTEALNMFKRMHKDGVHMDEFSFTTMLNLAANLVVLCYGVQVHSCMIKTRNIGKDGFSKSSLIHMYAKCSGLEEARRAFDDHGYSENFLHAVERETSARPMIKAFDEDKERENSSATERQTSKRELMSSNVMLAAYFHEGELDMGFNFFSSMAHHDTVTWNTVITGYFQNGHGETSLELFAKMVQEGVKLNAHSLANVLSACASLKALKHGRETHGWVLKNGYEMNSFISNSLVDMYCKCFRLQQAELIYTRICPENGFASTSLIMGYAQTGKLDKARRIFYSLTNQNIASWTAMISGYVKIQQSKASLNFFWDFLQSEKTTPDQLMLISVLSACAMQANLEKGKQIHAYIIRNGIEIEEKLGTELIDMYAKSGQIGYAKEVFQQLPIRDVPLYNAMIAGLGHHGREMEAIQLFQEMENIGIQPNGVTFIALLSACRHAGLLNSGQKYFNSMVQGYTITPESSHYASMIDLLGRANQLEQAVLLVRKSKGSNGLDPIVMGALIEACKRNADSKLAKELEEELLRVDPQNGARYVQLANVYAAEGKWGEMGRIRRKMKERDVVKSAGCSWIYVRNREHIFTAGDRTHTEAEAIYKLLANLNKEMKAFDTIST